MKPFHTPVFLDEILNFIPSRSDTVNIIDMTLGEGGHSEAFLKQGAHVLGVDRDEEIIASAKERLADFERMSYALCTYDDVVNHAPQRFIGESDLLLFDLGVSMYHFKHAQRGFSFQEESPLDMRLTHDASVSADSVVNEYLQDELERVFREYGEIRYAARLAQAIVDERRNTRIDSVRALENIIFHATPKKLRNAKIHPATRPFQAIRIEVNDEIAILERALEHALPLLREGGVMITIAYHSLEDRVCKRFMRRHSARYGDGQITPLSKKPLVPSDEEVHRNPAARSAKLRAARKNNADAIVKDKHEKA